MTPRQLKAAEKRVEKSYYARCSEIQIDIMDIGKVFKSGVAAIVANPGISDAELGDAVYAYVQTIRRN
jgi:hypothetical protein